MPGSAEARFPHGVGPHSSLTAEQEAVVIRRELAADSPDQYRPDLAESMNSLGITLFRAPCSSISRRASNCSIVSGSGTAPWSGRRPGAGRPQGVGEDVQEELADAAMDPAPRLGGGHDGGEVVVGEYHGGGFPRHVGAGAAHGDPDVGAAQRGRIVTASPVMARA